MSFEGYYQVLCKNGHYTNYDCYSLHADEPGWKCEVCGEGEAWSRIVDCTNGDDEPTKLEIAMQKKCNSCNSVLETRFVIPKGRR